MAYVALPGSAGDARTFASVRARQLGVFTSPGTVFDEEFTMKPGVSPSRWKTSLVTSGSVSILNNIPGGVMRLDSGASASSSAFASVGNGTDVPSMISDPGTGSTWYMLWIFRIATAIDAQTIANMQFDRASGVDTDALYFGADGQFVSTTKFMAETNTVSTQSSISIDTNWHYLEAWQIATARVINFGFDGEAPKVLTMTSNIGSAARPGINVTNGTTAASRQIDTDHFTLIMPGNAILPSVG